jgi:hypothetical protein
MPDAGVAHQGEPAGHIAAGVVAVQERQIAGQLGLVGMDRGYIFRGLIDPRRLRNRCGLRRQRLALRRNIPER